MDREKAGPWVYGDGKTGELIHTSKLQAVLAAKFQC